MQRHRLISILLQLTRREWKQWLDFVQSPYFNKHQATIALAQYLFHSRSELRAEALAGPTIHAHLFDSPYSEQAVRDVFSYLTRLTEQFLAQKNWEAQPVDPQLSLLASLRERRLLPAHQRAFKRLEKQLPAPDSLEQLYLHHRLAAEGLTTELQQRSRKEEARFQETLQHLDHYYLTYRLRYGCAQINRRMVVAGAGELDWVTQVAAQVQVLARQEKELPPILLIYWHLFELLSNPQGEGRFSQVLGLIPELAPSAQREVYAFLMNYCIQRANEGDRSYYPTLLDLYQRQLSDELLLENGQLSPADYKNIVSLALRNQELDWAETFIESYRKHLPIDQQTSAYIYQLAALHLERSNYSETLQLLREQEFTDRFYQLGARIMVLKVYFETQEIEGLYYRMEAFESFLQRNKKLSTYQKTLYRHFLRHLRKLARLQVQLSLEKKSVLVKKLTQFQQRLARFPNTAQREWLKTQTRLLQQQVE